MFVDQIICDRDSSSSGTASREKYTCWIRKVGVDPIERADHIMSANMAYYIVAIVRNIGSIAYMNVLGASQQKKNMIQRLMSTLLKCGTQTQIVMELTNMVSRLCCIP